MKYNNVTAGTFLSRPNRFIAHVEIDGKEEVVHVKNTGKMRELLLPGKRVYLQAANNPERKTKWDLIGVEKDGLGVVNIDSQAPNAVVKEWLLGGASPAGSASGSARTGANSAVSSSAAGKALVAGPDAPFPGAIVRPEYKFGNSRIDFYLEQGSRKILIEVKGCTLEIDGVGYFPDAPTKRGAKHLGELAGAVEQGYECYILYCIGMNGVTEVRPNRATDPEYGEAFDTALDAGVQPIFLQCRITEDEFTAIGNESRRNTFEK